MIWSVKIIELIINKIKYRYIYMLSDIVIMYVDIRNMWKNNRSFEQRLNLCLLERTERNCYASRFITCDTLCNYI
jgi:hypothetical protein